MANRQRRTVAVLGEMAELGHQSAAAHRAVGELAADLGVDVVVAIGEQAAPLIAAGASDGGVVAHLVPGLELAATLLNELLTTGDLVLVKASRADGLQALATALVQMDGAVATTDL